MPYDNFRQRVRRHRRTDLLLAIARVGAQMTRAELGQSEPLAVPNVVQPFSLAGVARTALIAGNDHRDTPVTLTDIVEMCAHYGNVYDPAIEAEGQLRHFLNRVAYEQFGQQLSVMESLGRTLMLFADHSSASATAPTPEDWHRLLGVPLEMFIRLGFALHVAALSNGGSIERATLRRHDLAQLFTPYTPAEAIEVVDRHFAATPEQMRSVGIAKEVRGLEKWSFNPLSATPLVILRDERYVMPSPRMVLDRISPAGLYFIGFDAFGRRFTDSLGKMFESYVGAHLQLLRHATIEPEIVYGASNERTVDYFVITSEVVVLVEVKSSRPIEATRLGEPEGDEDLVKKVGRAYEQIDNTARLLKEGHPKLAGIPKDRPVRGLVVTLEPFHIINSSFFDGVLSRPTTSTTVESAHTLEATVAVLQDATDTGARLLSALTPTTGMAGQLSKAAEGLTHAPNPLLDQAWDRFSAPWIDLRRDQEP